MTSPPPSSHGQRRPHSEYTHYDASLPRHRRVEDDGGRGVKRQMTNVFEATGPPETAKCFKPASAPFRGANTSRSRFDERPPGISVLQPQSDREAREERGCSTVHAFLHSMSEEEKRALKAVSKDTGDEDLKEAQLGNCERGWGSLEGGGRDVDGRDNQYVSADPFVQTAPVDGVHTYSQLRIESKGTGGSPVVHSAIANPRLTRHVSGGERRSSRRRTESKRMLPLRSAQPDEIRKTHSDGEKKVGSSQVLRVPKPVEPHELSAFDDGPVGPKSALGEGSSVVEIIDEETPSRPTKQAPPRRGVKPRESEPLLTRFTKRVKSKMTTGSRLRSISDISSGKQETKQAGLRRGRDGASQGSGRALDGPSANSSQSRGAGWRPGMKVPKLKKAECSEEVLAPPSKDPKELPKAQPARKTRSTPVGVNEDNDSTHLAVTGKKPFIVRTLDQWPDLISDLVALRTRVEMLMSESRSVWQLSFLGLTTEDLAGVVRACDIPNDNLSRTLNLNNNKIQAISAPICAGLERLNVSALNLSLNRLDTVHHLIAAWGDLRHLDLSRNILTTVPEEVGSLQNLTVLDVSRNKLESLPKRLSRLKNLEVLILAQNRLKHLPEDLVDKEAILTCLDVSCNPELDDLPKILAELEHLEVLKYRETGLRKKLITRREAQTLSPTDVLKKWYFPERLETTEKKDLDKPAPKDAEKELESVT